MLLLLKNELQKAMKKQNLFMKQWPIKLQKKLAVQLLYLEGKLMRLS